MKRRSLSIFLCLLMLAAVFATVPMCVSASNTIYIRPDGSVDPASAPIQVQDDEYTLTADIYEFIHIQRSGITLLGGGYTIQGSGTGFGVLLESVSDVTLKDLIVKGFDQGIELDHSDHNTIIECIATESATNGIRLSASSFNIITKNDVYSNNWDGIVLRKVSGIGSSDNLITDNKAYNNYVAGIRIRDNQDQRNSISENTVYGQMYGIWVMAGDYSKVEKNIAYQNSEAGIYFTGMPYGLLENNLAYQNSKEGIFCWGIQYSVVRENTIQENGERGLMIRAGIYSTYEQNTILNNKIGIGFRRGATGHNLIQQNWVQGHEIGLNIFDKARNNNVVTMNTFTQCDIGAVLDSTSSVTYLHHNKFIDNSAGAYDDGANIWDDDTGEGNFWSDYTGLDNGDGGRIPDDGVGDTDIPHAGVDWYPLMDPWGPDDEVEKIIENIEEMGLPHGIENSLISKLKNAIKSIIKDQSSASGQLGAFINEVNAQSGKKLTVEQANDLITAAENILAMI
ncbi:MAG: right-handed parallel beta-helix repeat-containing protein [Thermoplasmata archaeon]|nr:MAG: right-handed parallel beta-helix repeat-containing protein [Thermoplasmata archaeon]